MNSGQMTENGYLHITSEKNRVKYFSKKHYGCQQNMESVCPKHSKLHVSITVIYAQTEGSTETDQDGILSCS